MLGHNLDVQGVEIFHVCYSIYEELSLNKARKLEDSN